MIWQQLDYSALQPITLAQVMKNKVVIGLILTALVGIVTLFITVLRFALDDAWWMQGNSSGYLMAAVVVASAAALFIPMAIHYSFSTILTRRLNEFVRANSDYVARFKEDRPKYNEGVVFSRVKGSSLRDVEEISGRLDSDYAIGNVKFAGKKMGYIRLKLPRAMPNMIVDARQGQLFRSNLPTVLQKNQGLSLEGDFNNYYQLYVPKEYEPDALYVFTPDVMELLVQSGADYDVEIVNDVLYLYRAEPFDFMNQTEVSETLWLTEGFSNTLYGRTVRYKDTRVAHPERKSVALDGRQLQQRERALTTLDKMSYDKKFYVQSTIVAGIVILGIVIAIGVFVFLSWLEYTKM